MLRRCIPRLILRPNTSHRFRLIATTEKFSQVGQPEPKINPQSVCIREIIESLNVIPKKAAELNAKAKLSKEIHNNDAQMAQEQGALFYRQLQIEEEQQSDAVTKYINAADQLRKMGKGSNFKHVQRIVLRWYDPLVQEILAEIKLVQFRVQGVDRMFYGPIFMMLSPEKLAVITLESTVNLILSRGNQGDQVTALAHKIGELVEAEVNIAKMQKSPDGVMTWKMSVMKEALKNKSGGNRAIMQRIRRLIDADDWTPTIRVKVGAALISLLLRSAKVNDETRRPAFLHSIWYSSFLKRRVSTIKLDEEVFQSLTYREEFMPPRYLPMLVPPKPWDNRRRGTSCYYRLKARLLRTFSMGQMEALRQADMSRVVEGLNYLGKIPWAINKPVLDAVKGCWEQAIYVGELPSKETVPPPNREDCKRPIMVKGVPVGEPVFDQRYHNEMKRRVELKNAELHALRCDMQLKLWVADKFGEDRFYFPYSLDFRGRAYPVPPNLNHLGSDLCRGVLMFADALPLGSKGLFWLKVHLANLFGNNKIAQADRAKWTESNWEKVVESASSPLSRGKDGWWMTAEEPFQALATCIELVNASQYPGGHEAYPCRLPVHQDGSCNGLQHYAALGRDAVGGAAVNLVNGEVPADVYSTVLEVVHRKLEEDALIPRDDPLGRIGEFARIVKDVVDRKVIKQTVMTSVYGVTKRGAALQVQARLEEKLGVVGANGVTDLEVEKKIKDCSSYVASLTLESLRETFNSAKSIMDWLSMCATIVATQGQVMAWVTPLGLPVIQPYRKTTSHVVKTMLQTISLTLNSDSLPVSIYKQRSAFAPNFVHSLDATHMILTALKMKQKNLVFAAVHDSYWTHPCNVETMNSVLRDCFIELYEQPVLESLRDSLELRFPDATFPPVPERGSLDLKLVKDSTYFFH